MRDKIICVYTITNISNNKIYVGQSVDFSSRKNTHICLLKSNKHPNLHLQNAFLKYGDGCLKIEVLIECKQEYLNSEENYWINLLNTTDRLFGYNIKTNDPNGSYKVSQETKNRISQAHIGIKHTVETCLKLSEINKGKTHSKETLKRMSESHLKRGFVMTEEHKEKLRKGNFLRKGKLSEEQRNNISLWRSRVVEQYSMDDIFVKSYKSITEASKATGISLSNISLFAQGKRKTAGNYKWIFKV